MIKWKGSARKWSWAILRYYPSMCLKASHEKPQDSYPSVEDSNLGPPEFEAGGRVEFGN
jgi:hypothetical protein